MTTADAQFFWSNHSGGPAWCEEYRLSTWQAPRDWVVEAVRAIGDVRSVLELGCHCGPLLRRLAVLPGMETAAGMDINAEAVMAAKADGLLAFVGALPDALDRLSDRSVDVVVSSYCLAYIAPADIVRTLVGMLRIAKRGLVLAEPTAGPGVSEAETTRRQYVEWRHEYLDVLERARMDYGLRSLPPCIEAMRVRKDGDANINAVITARLTWPS